MNAWPERVKQSPPTRWWSSLIKKKTLHVAPRTRVYRNLHNRSQINKQLNQKTNNSFNKLSKKRRVFAPAPSRMERVRHFFKRLGRTRKNLNAPTHGALSNNSVQRLRLPPPPVAPRVSMSNRLNEQNRVRARELQKKRYQLLRKYKNLTKHQQNYAQKNRHIRNLLATPAATNVLGNYTPNHTVSNRSINAEAINRILNQAKNVSYSNLLKKAGVPSRPRKIYLVPVQSRVRLGVR